MLIMHPILAAWHSPNGGDPCFFQFAAGAERPLGLDLQNTATGDRRTIQPHQAAFDPAIMDLA